MGNAPSLKANADALPDDVVRAEVQRILEQRYLERYIDTRTLKYFLGIVGFGVAFAVFPFIRSVREFLHVGPLGMILPTAGVVGAIGLATLAAHGPGGILGKPHRNAERAESVAVAAFSAFMIRAAGTATSIFWLLSVMHALYGAQEAMHAKWNYRAHGVLLGLVALSFALEGHFGDAAASAFFVLLLMFLSQSNHAVVLREIRREAERNVALVEGERQRIARDLHDGIGAQLASLAWTAEGDIGERARVLLNELREVVRGLKATDMQLGPFAESLASSCRALTKGAKFDLATEGDALVRAEVGLEVMLIVREAVRNAAQHAEPKRIDVKLAVTDGQLRVSVEDDGRGLAPGAEDASRGGLSHLSRRAAVLGGTIAFERPNVGTRIALVVPLTES